MKELKSYISEGFFNNVGANNIVKPVIDTIKDASTNDKIDSDDKKYEFHALLKSILEDVETNMKKGKLVFEYNRADATCVPHKITISLEMVRSNIARWIYSSKDGKFGWSADAIAFDIAEDLYYEAIYPAKERGLRHCIANTIKVIEFKLS